jgi:hypothetical protein
LNSDTTILLFRLGIVAVLYLFLWEVVRTVWRDLGSAVVFHPQARTAANLEIISSGRARLHAGEVIVLDRATTIGREADNDVVVDEETVSGQHARIVTRQGRWWIEDLQSTNGTWVNDAHVVGSQALGKGDVIRVGRVRLRFSV